MLVRRIVDRGPDRPGVLDRREEGARVVHPAFEAGDAVDSPERSLDVVELTDSVIGPHREGEDVLVGQAVGERCAGHRCETGDERGASVIDPAGGPADGGVRRDAAAELACCGRRIMVRAGQSDGALCDGNGGGDGDKVGGQAGVVVGAEPTGTVVLGLLKQSCGLLPGDGLADGGERRFAVSVRGACRQCLLVGPVGALELPETPVAAGAGGDTVEVDVQDRVGEPTVHGAAPGGVGGDRLPQAGGRLPHRSQGGGCEPGCLRSYRALREGPEFGKSGGSPECHRLDRNTERVRDGAAVVGKLSQRPAAGPQGLGQAADLGGRVQSTDRQGQRRFGQSGPGLRDLGTAGCVQFAPCGARGVAEARTLVGDHLAPTGG